MNPISPRPETFVTEIKLEIIRHALTCSEPLAFCPLPLSAAEAKNITRRHFGPIYSSTLRLALLDKCAYDEPIAQELMTTFINLSLVSKSTRLFAKDMFYGENKWVLHVTRTFDAVEWISQHWGKEVLRLMRHVRIEAQALRERCYDALELFVEEVSKGGRLSSLEVQWLEPSRPLQCAYNARGGPASWHFHPMERDRGLERNAKGGRGLIVPPGEEEHYHEDDYGTKYEGESSEPWYWKEDEVSLIPLCRLRGLKNVRIEGTVTEKWAKWLEKAATAKLGEDVEAFNFASRARDAISRLNAQAFEHVDDMEAHF